MILLNKDSNKGLMLVINTLNYNKDSGKFDIHWDEGNSR